MTTAPATQRLTADEYLALPETGDGPRLQLVEGEVVVNDPAALHGHVQTNVLFALVAWTRAAPARGHAVVPRDVAIDEHNVFSPDILWYAPGRLPDPNSPPPYSLPDLAVEIRSPSTWRYDVGAKKAGYERQGLTELWLVDTVARTVSVFRRSVRGWRASTWRSSSTTGRQSSRGSCRRLGLGSERCLRSGEAGRAAQPGEGAATHGDGWLIATARAPIRLRPAVPEGRPALTVRGRDEPGCIIVLML